MVGSWNRRIVLWCYLVWWKFVYASSVNFRGYFCYVHRTKMKTLSVSLRIPMIHHRVDFWNNTESRPAPVALFRLWFRVFPSLYIMHPTTSSKFTSQKKWISRWIFRNGFSSGCSWKTDASTFLETLPPKVFRHQNPPERRNPRTVRNCDFFRNETNGWVNRYSLQQTSPPEERSGFTWSVPLFSGLRRAVYRFTAPLSSPRTRGKVQERDFLHVASPLKATILLSFAETLSLCSWVCGSECITSLPRCQAQKWEFWGKIGDAWRPRFFKQNAPQDWAYL